MAKSSKMIDLARTAKEMKAEVKQEYKPSVYAYGTEMRLEDEELTKLGNPTAAVGDEFEMMVRVKVTGKRESEREGASLNRSLTLQITHVEMPGEVKAEGEKAATLFEDKS